MSDEINVAIVGYGLAGAVFHGPLVAGTAGMRVAAVVAGSKEAQARRDFPQARIIARAEALWKKPEGIDVAVIATPNRTHAELATQAMRCGLHAVVDKPMATSVAEGERLVEAARRQGKILTVFHNRRWDNDFLTVRRLLAEGALGTLLRFESRYERFRPAIKADAWRERGNPEDAGGVLFDLGAHCIDQALLLFGMPSSVYAETLRRRPGAEVDDDSFLALSYPSGLRVHLWMSQVAGVLGPRFRLLGLDGGFEKFGVDPQEDQLRSGMRPGQPGWGIEPESRSGRLQLVDSQRTVPSLPGSYESFYALLRDAIRNGTPFPVAPEEALNVLRIIELARPNVTD